MYVTTRLFFWGQKDVDLANNSWIVSINKVRGVDVRERGKKNVFWIDGHTVITKWSLLWFTLAPPFMQMWWEPLNRCRRILNRFRADLPAFLILLFVDTHILENWSCLCWCNFILTFSRIITADYAKSPPLTAVIVLLPAELYEWNSFSVILGALLPGCYEHALALQITLI